MKWFKHMTDASRDEKITQLFQIHRHKGVMIYFWILENIAEKMDESEACELTHHIQHWAKILRTYSDDLRKILVSCEHLGLLIVVSNGHQTTISCPKLLKIRARKKPIGNKTRSLDIEVEEEVDIEEEREESTKQKPNGIFLGADFSWVGISEKDFEAWKAAYPALNLKTELARMAQWAMANPEKKKKKWRSFIVRWLSRQQERSGSIPIFKAGSDYQVRPRPTTVKKQTLVEINQEEREKIKQKLKLFNNSL